MALGLSKLTKFLRAHSFQHSNHNYDFSTAFFKSSHVFWLLISITTSVSDKKRLSYCSNSKSHLSGQELNKADIQNVGIAQMLHGRKQAASKGRHKIILCSSIFPSLYPFCRTLGHVSLFPLILTYTYHLFSCFFLVNGVAKTHSTEIGYVP